MGKIRDVAQDWLSDYGYELGYDWDNLPNMVNWESIKLNKTKPKEYYEQNRCKK